MKAVPSPDLGQKKPDTNSEILPVLLAIATKVDKSPRITIEEPSGHVVINVSTPTAEFAAPMINISTVNDKLYGANASDSSFVTQSSRQSVTESSFVSVGSYRSSGNAVESVIQSES